MLTPCDEPNKFHLSSAIPRRSQPERGFTKDLTKQPPKTHINNHALEERDSKKS